MAKTKAKKKNVSAGGIVGMVVAALLLIALLGGVIFYVHSGGAGRSESAGIVSANSTTEVSQTTTEEATTEEAEETTAAESTTEKAIATDNTVTTKKNSAKVAFKSSVTAKQMGKYFAASPEATFNAYDSKTVTLSGTLSDKSAKMLYVELKTGTDTPCRVYLNSEEQREQFYNMSIGSTVKVKGEMAIVLPSDMDQGGFQEMANGLIGMNNVTIEK